MTLFPSLEENCEALKASFDLIAPARKAQLELLANFVATELNKSDEVELNVICTHNSRRSHIGQLWLLAAAHYYGISTIQIYSGGTEATAFHPNAVAALQRMGFEILAISPNPNPRYAARISEELPADLLFSKTFDSDTNPDQNFGAIMVCSEADEACPLVPGATFRISLPFVDPKAVDHLPEVESYYDKTCHEIGRQALYVMHLAQLNLGGLTPSSLVNPGGLTQPNLGGLT